MTGSPSPTSSPLRKSTILRDSDGWDQPPAVAYPTSSGWIPLPCKWKTPQRIMSLCPDLRLLENVSSDTLLVEGPSGGLLCGPLIVCNNRYVIVALGTSIMLFGCSKESTIIHDGPSRSIDFPVPARNTVPLAHLSLISEEAVECQGRPATGSITGITQMVFHEESSILYILTVESCVFQAKLIDPTATSTNGSQGEPNIGPDTAGAGPSDRIKPPTFRLLQTWFTKEFGAACMASLYNGGGDGVDIVCVGYTSGHIEAWNVHQNVLPHLHQHSRKKAKFVSKRWKGYLCPSIRTIAFLPRGCQDLESKEQNVGDSKQDELSPSKIQTKDASDLFIINDHYLIVSTQTFSGASLEEEQQPTSSMLEFLNLKRIEDLSSEGHQNEDIAFIDCTLAPIPGMELVDSITIPKSADCLPKRCPVLDTRGAGAAITLNNNVRGGATKNGNPRVSMLLPDGTVALISSNPDMTDAVGITEEIDQMVLSYPAIGSGVVTMRDTDVSYLVCCLRGGTCYLIPLGTTNKGPILTIPFPQDISSNLVNEIYVQAFSAGNLFVEEHFLPVLLYAWPDGVVDVYSCELIHPKPANDKSPLSDSLTSQLIPVSRLERQVLQEMLDNGITQLLSQLRHEARKSSEHPLLQQEDWKEFFNGPWSHNSITLDALCSTEFQNLRSMMLSLARKESEKVQS